MHDRDYESDGLSMTGDPWHGRSTRYGRRRWQLRRREWCRNRRRTPVAWWRRGNRGVECPTLQKPLLQADVTDCAPRNEDNLRWLQQIPAQRKCPRIDPGFRFMRC